MWKTLEHTETQTRARRTPVSHTDDYKHHLDYWRWNHARSQHDSYYYHYDSALKGPVVVLVPQPLNLLTSACPVDVNTRQTQILVSGAWCCGQRGDAGEISASWGTHCVTSTCLQPFVVFKVLIQHKKEKNQLLVFIRKSNSFYFPYTQMNIYFSKIKWNKNNNSLTSTFYFSIAETCMLEAADPEVHLRLHLSSWSLLLKYTRHRTRLV